MGEQGGEVALWRLAADAGEEDEDAGLEVRWWGGSGVARWLKDYVTRVPGGFKIVQRGYGPANEKDTQSPTGVAGATVDALVEAALLRRVRDERLRGAQLLDMPLRELLCRFGYGSSVPLGASKIRKGSQSELWSVSGVEDEETDGVRARLIDELRWLRREPLSLERVRILSVRSLWT